MDSVPGRTEASCKVAPEGQHYLLVAPASQSINNVAPVALLWLCINVNLTALTKTAPLERDVEKQGENTKKNK